MSGAMRAFSSIPAAGPIVLLVIVIIIIMISAIKRATRLFLLKIAIATAVTGATTSLTRHARMNSIGMFAGEFGTFPHVVCLCSDSADRYEQEIWGKFMEVTDSLRFKTDVAGIEGVMD